MNTTLKRIILILSLALGGGLGYYLIHQKPVTSHVAVEPRQENLVIDDYDQARDEQDIKNTFYDEYYWLYPDESYDVETHVGFMLKYKAPNENPLYVGTLYVKVARLEGKFVGFTAYHKETVIRGRLLFLAINKNFRKRGFGEQLARYAVEQLKQLGFHTIVLVTRVNNPAQKIYKRIGFIETSHDDEFLNMAYQVK